MRKSPLTSLLIGAGVCAIAALPTLVVAKAPAEASATAPAATSPAVAQVSARALLADLDVAQEARARPFRASRFGDGLDAAARAAVLVAASSEPVSRDDTGAVTAGRWTSPYDGAVLTAAKRVGIDRPVSLQEAWRSGAASWTAQERTAFADDTTGLAVVSSGALRAKHGDDAAGYLPTARSFRCAYAKDVVTVKTRWGLSVDPAERRVLSRTLSRWCDSLLVPEPVGSAPESK